MSSKVTVRHNAETGHRLPHLGNAKCQNLHGHSWWIEVEVTGPLADNGTVIEFGDLKRLIRNWIDANLDHGLMLGQDDPLAAILPEHGKVFVFGRGAAAGLEWPTVENVAVLMARVTEATLITLGVTDDVYVSRVTVTETHVNSATWTSHGTP